MNPAHYLSAKTLADELQTNPKLVEAINVLVHELSLRRSRDATDPWPANYWERPARTTDTDHAPASVTVLLVADDSRKALIMPPLARDITFHSDTLEAAIAKAQAWVDEQRVQLHTRSHWTVRGWHVVPGHRLGIER